jgi:hypothetical protein
MSGVGEVLDFDPAFLGDERRPALRTSTSTLKTFLHRGNMDNLADRADGVKDAFRASAIASV